MWRCVQVAAAGLLIAGCWNGPGGGPGPAAQSGDPADVYEAVFRHLLQKHPADVPAFVSVDGQDPPADLLNRLRRDWPNLKPVSDEPKVNGYVVYVEKLMWDGRDAAELRAGHRYNTRVAPDVYFGDHRVVREGGRWVVKSVTNETMS
jgi:hypothetical protein